MVYSSKENVERGPSLFYLLIIYFLTWLLYPPPLLPCIGANEWQNHRALRTLIFICICNCSMVYTERIYLKRPSLFYGRLTWPHLSHPCYNIRYVHEERHVLLLAFNVPASYWSVSAQDGRLCQFPFQFRGREFTACTSEADPDGRWASLRHKINNK